jgi:dolichol-phosphate mannosyltransferase
MIKKLVLIPTYNERENIKDITKAVMDLAGDFSLLVIDDGSPDGTASLVKDMMLEYPGRLFIEERSGKLGLGTAYIHGFKWALKHGYDYVFEMDADFSHNPNDLIRLFDACSDGKHSMSVGSRYTRGGKLENWPWNRVLLSYGASLYVRIVTFMPVKDPTAGFVCYKREVLENLDLDKIKFIGYAFQIEMKFATRSLGYKIKEVPITFKDREKGTSKMSTKIFKEAVIGVLKMRWNSFFNSYRKSLT